MAMRWHLRLLGGFVLARDGREIRRFRYQKAALLLAYLSLHPHQAHAREVLIERLWPGDDPERSRNRFRVLLTTLRHVLEPPGTAPQSVLITPSTGLLQLHPSSVQTDVAAFQDAVRRRDFPRALASYAGPLLPQFYEDWVLLERERLEELAEQARRGAAIASVAPVPPSDSRGWIPAPLTAFFGREEELTQVVATLEEARLVTLHGPGGIGKTRLAIEAAQRLRERYGDVTFVALGEERDAGQLPGILSRAFELDLAADGRYDGARLAAHLERRQTLLILDNFEQLVSGGGPLLLEALLQSAPSLRCLVTSRRILGIGGERMVPVGPLALPGSAASLADSVDTPAVALFLDRARGVRPDFVATARTIEAIVGICRIVDGIPLALELAAARLRAATPMQVREGLIRRFDLLTRSERWSRKANRHGSLRLALDWSWNLLPADFQRFYAHLSVFSGGCLADAAAAVADVENGTDVLEALAGDALVRPEAQRETTRFLMLETLREFASEHLTPSDRAGAARRHADFYRRFLEDAEERRVHATGVPLSQWLADILPERENLRAALEFYRDDPASAEELVALTGTCTFLWIHLGMCDEGEHWVHLAEAREGVAGPTRAFLLYRGSWLALRRRELDVAHRRTEEAFRLYRALGDPRGHSFGWNARGNVARSRGELSVAHEAFTHAIAWGRQVENARFPDTTVYEDIPAGNLAEVLIEQGDADRAKAILTRLLERERARGVRHGSGIFRNYIVATERLGDDEGAEALWLEFLNEAYPASNYYGVFEALSALARLRRRRDTPDASAFAEAVDALRDASPEGWGALTPSDRERLITMIDRALQT
jgi:non-specific serine/threonine protein kinase